VPLRSMTGYAQVRGQVNAGLAFALALKSVNHRFLDLHFRVPSDADALEMKLRRLLKESDVTVYSIGILDGSDAGSSMGMEGQGILDELSSVSGGKAFFPNTEAEMDEIFERIALELRHQYSIGYRPTNFANDGKWHKIKVKVTPPRGLPRLFVRSKEGYYSSATPR